MLRLQSKSLHGPSGLISGLTAQQEAWLDSVRYANVSSKWPTLSKEQLVELWTKVYILSKATSTNFPYNEAGRLRVAVS